MNQEQAELIVKKVLEVISEQSFCMCLDELTVAEENDLIARAVDRIKPLFRVCLPHQKTS